MSEAFDPRWVTPDRLRSAGWSRTQMRAAIRDGEFSRDVRGLWLPADAVDDLYHRCAAALATQREDAAISHGTAAFIHGFAWLPDGLGAPTRDIDVTVARDDLTRSSRRGIDRRSRMVRVPLAQGDLGYWRWLIWIEYDGVEVHEPLRMDGKDQRKDRWLGRRGWEPFRLTKLDVKAPELFLRELGIAIEQGPARVAALDPARSPEVLRAHQLLGLT